MSRCLRGLLILFSIVCVSNVQAQTTAPAEDLAAEIRFPVEKYKLPNGLTVLLYQDRSVPMISYNTWFKVGSKFEHFGYTGIAHLFEHMMFKGSKRYSGKEYDLILQANGARNNAFTTQDYTGFYVDLPSSKLELVMDMESDRMVNLQLNQQSLSSEKEVVKEERRMRVDNDPMGTLEEAVFANVFKISPYHWPVIGWMADINRIDLARAQDYYRTYYAPNNAVLVLAGDFSIHHAKNLIEKYYGPMKPQPIPPLNWVAEPNQKSPRSQVIKRDVQAITIADAYKTCPAGNEDSYALDLISNILSHGTSSRLYQKLVYDRQLADSVDADSTGLQNSGMFQVTVSLKPGVGTSRVQAAVLSELNKMRTDKVSDKELQKAKNQIMKDYVDALKTIHGKAQSLAYNEVIFGDYTKLFSDLSKYNAVTPDEIQAVAKKYLQPEQRSYIVLKPNK